MKEVIIFLIISLFLIVGCDCAYNCKNVKCPGAYCDNGQCKCPIMGIEKECTQDSGCSIKYQVYANGGCSAGCFNKDVKPDMDRCGDIKFEYIIGACECVNNQCELKQDQKECSLDTDCIKGGCSGTICQSKNSEPIITTCEYLPEYACYEDINCGCIEGICQWNKTEDFSKCLEEKRKSNGEVVV